MRWLGKLLWYTLNTKFLQFQPKVQQKFFNCRRFDYSVVVFFKACMSFDYSVVVFFKACMRFDYSAVKTLAIQELLLNFGLELKKLRDKFYSHATERIFE